MVPERSGRVKFIRRETTETRKANFITVCLSFLTFEGRFTKLTECGFVLGNKRLYHNAASM